eukprot:scaffold2448_cov250-Pinguiococcus_pyrenoidosus.AAC.15
MYYWIIIVFGVIAWIIGFFQADFQTTVIGWGIGLALATLVRSARRALELELKRRTDTLSGTFAALRARLAVVQPPPDPVARSHSWCGACFHQQDW